MAFKALVVDIDGTITHKDRRLNLRAVEVLHDLDVPVVLATGNVICYAKAASKLMGLGGQVIAENGGLVTIAYDAKPVVADTMQECETALDFLSQHYDLTRLDPEFRRTEIALRRNFDASEARELLLSNGFEVDVVDTKYAIHIKSTKIDKSTGLVNISGLMGLKPSDFVAIGDSQNDVEMLRAAGFSIAVNNAEDVIKESADMVTKASFGDGAVEAIEYLLSKGWL